MRLPHDSGWGTLAAGIALTVILYGITRALMSGALL